LNYIILYLAEQYGKMLVIATPGQFPIDLWPGSTEQYAVAGKKEAKAMDKWK